jgi:hypothetical protein
LKWRPTKPDKGLILFFDAAEAGVQVHIHGKTLKIQITLQNSGYATHASPDSLTVFI